MKKVGLLILLTAFLFGTMEVALKIAGNGLDSFQLTFLRFIRLWVSIDSRNHMHTDQHVIFPAGSDAFKCLNSFRNYVYKSIVYNDFCSLYVERNLYKK